MKLGFFFTVAFNVFMDLSSLVTLSNLFQILIALYLRHCYDSSANAMLK